jgi:hypothetical protein
MVGQCALVNTDVGLPVYVNLASCDACFSKGGIEGGHWKTYVQNVVQAYRAKPNHIPESNRALFERLHGPLGATEPSGKDRWDKVRSTWEMAESFLLSLKSRGVGAVWGGGNRVELTIKGRRHVSCFGTTLEGALVSDRCPSLAQSADGIHHFCNDCGCGDREIARLDGQEGEYTKLDYPYLQCPRGRDGFDNPPSCGVPERVLSAETQVARALRVEGTTPEHDLKWLLKWAEEIKPRRTVEIGTYKGRTAALLAGVSGWVDTVDDFSGGWVRGAEPSSPPFEHETRRNLEPYPNVAIHKRGDDAELIRVLGRGLAGLVFVDGNHSYDAVVKDLHLALELRAPDGVICGHDWAMPDVQDAVRSVLGEPTAVGDWMWRWEGPAPKPLSVRREATPDIIFLAEHCGVGDVVAQCWIAEGINRTGKRAAFFTHNTAYQRIIRMFGQNLTSRREGAIPLGGTARHYQYELRVDKGHTGRVPLWASLMPIKATPARPPFLQDQEGVTLAENFVRAAEGRPIALLFPLADHGPRRWPMGHFVDLAWTFKDRHGRAKIRILMIEYDRCDRFWFDHGE